LRRKVPNTNILADEVITCPEHTIKVGHRRNVPTRNVRVKRVLVLKQLAHVCNSAHVPILHLKCPRDAAVYIWFGAALHAGRIAVGCVQAAVHRGLECGPVRERLGSWTLTNKIADMNAPRVPRYIDTVAVIPPPTGRVHTNTILHVGIIIRFACSKISI